MRKIILIFGAMAFLVGFTVTTIPPTPERKIVNRIFTISLTSGDTIEIRINGEVYQNLQKTIPQGKKIELQFEIQGELVDE